MGLPLIWDQVVLDARRFERFFADFGKKLPIIMSLYVSSLPRVLWN
jgi:hypothetical protein